MILDFLFGISTTDVGLNALGCSKLSAPKHENPFNFGAWINELKCIIEHYGHRFQIMSKKVETQKVRYDLISQSHLSFFSGALTYTGAIENLTLYTSLNQWNPSVKFQLLCCLAIGWKRSRSSSNFHHIAARLWAGTWRKLP